jgi:DNA polymerase-4
MSKIIAHIDLNAFFASVEQIEQPHLQGKPVAIGGEGRRGMVVTASYEARKYGVKAGMPAYQAKMLCPSLIFVGHHFDSYHRYSELFKAFIKKHTQKVEMGSIDECYADFSHLDFTKIKPKPFFEKLQKELFQTLQLPSSWGIAPTKFLAKMASDMQKPMGLTILRKRDIPTLLYPLPVQAMYGIGKKTYPHLLKLGMKTIGDLTLDKYDEKLRTILGKFYFTVKMWLQGEGDDIVDDQEHDPKSIGSSTTLSFNTADFQIIEPIIKTLIEDVYERAKKNRLLAKGLTLIVKRPDFKVMTRSITLDEPSMEMPLLTQKFIHLFQEQFKDLELRLVGVSLHQLFPENKVTRTISVFDGIGDVEKHNQTEQLIESINAKYKRKIIKRASQFK